MPIKTSRLKSLWPSRYFFLSVAVNIVALVISLRPHTTETVIRLTGLALQLLGISTVVWGISETRSLFGHPSLTSKAKAWFSRLLLLRQNVVIAPESDSFQVTSGKAMIYQMSGVGANLTPDARLDAYEKNIVLLHERISQMQKEVDKDFQKAADLLKRETQQRQAENGKIRQTLEATGTGGIHISAIGASWLFFGVILSTAAVEIAKLIK
jgi:hypothetical protein